MGASGTPKLNTRRPGCYCAANESAIVAIAVPAWEIHATAEVIRDKVLTVETQGSGRFS
jgi:hypothetical protein